MNQVARPCIETVVAVVFLALVEGLVQPPLAAADAISNGSAKRTNEPPAVVPRKAFADTTAPLLTSWMTENGGRYARVVEMRGGKQVTTWPSPGLPDHGGGQSQPAYADIQQVSYSPDWVYVKGTGLASHQMGPWYIGLNRIFGNWPSNANYIRRFPRHPEAAAVKTTNGLGPLGLWVNGVALFNLLDGFGYDPQSGRDVQGGPEMVNGGYVWVRNAVVVEQPTFDASNAHQPPNGNYHYHDNPLALRYQLGDHVAYDAAINRYSELPVAHNSRHSPILGWSYDGYPIYGPYGYDDPQNPSKGVRRMVSGFVVRDGADGTDDLRRVGRHSLARWSSKLHDTSTALTPERYGPDVSPRATLGRYVEDFDFLGDRGKLQGRDFDLDIYNGRFCITPEFPHGTYAYFVTLNADGSPAFPYVIGRQWYGTPSGGQGNRIVEKVTVFTNAGPNATTPTAVVAKNGTVSWRSTEGAHYALQASKNGREWTTVASDVSGQGVLTTFSLPKAARNTTMRYRITQISLDSYDATGQNQRQGRGRRGGPGGPGEGQGRNAGGDGPEGTIDNSSPNSILRGDMVTLRWALGSDPPPPPAEVAPAVARLGSLSAQKVEWDGTTLTATFLIPANFPAGSSDITVSFPAPPGREGFLTFTGKGLVTIR